MNTQRIHVAVLGTGPVANLITQRIEKRADLDLIATFPSSETPPQNTDCVLYLPTSAELATGTAATRICDLLRAGFDVVSTAPSAALHHADLLGACRTGGSTFHGSGGFQNSLVTRFNRAFSTITRNIRQIELIEELDVEEMPAHPWESPGDAGFDADDPQTVQVRASAVEGYYDAGLRTLSEAVFGTALPDEAIAFSATHVDQNDQPLRSRNRNQDAVEQVIVRRAIGSQVIYDSIWTKRHGSTTPLRYHLNTTSSDAIGHATITFHAQSAVRPTDHLACMGLLDAIRPVYESAPGILHHDLEINHVKLNECLLR